MILDDFLTWEKRVKPEIGHIGFILSQKLSDEPMELINDLRDVESWSARCGYLLAESNSFLDKFELVAMPPKEGRTEKDREVLLKSESAPIRLVRDILERYCDSINRRISLGQTILSFHKNLPAMEVKVV